MRRGINWITSNSPEQYRKIHLELVEILERWCLGRNWIAMDSSESNRLRLPPYEFAQVSSGQMEPIIVDSPATPVPIEAGRGLSFRTELQSFADMTQDREEQAYLADLLEHVLDQNIMTTPFSQLATTSDPRSLKLHEQNIRSSRSDLGLPTAPKSAYLLFCDDYIKSRPDGQRPPQEQVNAALHASKDSTGTIDFEAGAAEARATYLTALEAWQESARMS